jgi:hypothetical protein
MVGQILMVPYRAGIGKYKAFIDKHGETLLPVAFACLHDGYTGPIEDDISGDLARIVGLAFDHRRSGVGAV